ncbi:MAG: hypothetical protein JW704_09845 [Anaerolineaceae bacterium]|nr:hypothetical protein [Anaerolineaceae bacterium]
MAVGLIEAFWLFEQFGRPALDDDDILFMAMAKRKKGCRMIPNTLTKQEAARVLEIGDRLKKWKDEHR